MLQYVAILLAALALWACPFWGRPRRTFLPLYLWAIYSAVAPIPIIGRPLLDYRWELGALSGVVGLYWWWKGPKRGLDEATIIPGLFVGLAFASVAWSELPDYSLFRALGLLPIYGFVFLGGWSLIHYKEGLRSVAVCCFAHFAIALGLVSASPADTGLPALGGEADRFMGHLKATGSAIIIVASLPFWLWQMKHRPRAPRWLYLAGFAFWVFLLMATKTRGSILAFTLVMPAAWATIISSGKTGKLLLGSMLFGCAALITLLMLPEDEVKSALRAQSARELVATRVDGRWDIIWARCLESPLKGHGIGMSRFYMSRNPEYDLANPDMSRLAHQAATHNEPLTQLYELGIFAPIALLAFFAKTLRSVWNIAKANPGPDRGLILAAGFSASTLIIDTMFHDGYLSIGNPHNVFFWLSCMTVIAGCRPVSRQHQSK